MRHMTKIIGIRQAVSDIKTCPAGFHVEVWSRLDDKGDIQVYTSEYLSMNSWTNPARHRDERQIRWRDVEDEMAAEGKRCSLTDLIRIGAMREWGLDAEPETPGTATGIKTVRRSGGALVVTITDMAKAVDAAEGDMVDVTITRRE